MSYQPGTAADFSEASEEPRQTFGASGAGVEVLHQDGRGVGPDSTTGEGGEGKKTNFFGGLTRGFKALDMSSVKERTKAASASFSSASAGIAGKMSSLGSTLKKEANSLRKDVAAIMTEKDDRKPGDDAVTATSSGSAGMGPAALRPNELSPSQSGSAGVGPAALRSNELPPGQLRCFSCAMLMAYPPGVMQVRCPGCNTINNTPPPPAVSDVERGMGALSMVTQVLDPRASASTAQVRPQAPGAVNPVYGQQGVEASEEAMIQEAIRISLGQAPADSNQAHAHSAGMPAGFGSGCVLGQAENTVSGGNANPLMGETEKALAVSAVSDITGCDAEVALYLLETNAWTVEAAVNQYLESGMGAEITDTFGAQSSETALAPNSALSSSSSSSLPPPGDAPCLFVPVTLDDLLTEKPPVPDSTSTLPSLAATSLLDLDDTPPEATVATPGSAASLDVFRDSPQVQMPASNFQAVALPEAARAREPAIVERHVSEDDLLGLSDKAQVAPPVLEIMEPFPSDTSPCTAAFDDASKVADKAGPCMQSVVMLSSTAASAPEACGLTQEAEAPAKLDGEHVQEKSELVADAVVTAVPMSFAPSVASAAKDQATVDEMLGVSAVSSAPLEDATLVTSAGGPHALAEESEDIAAGVVTENGATPKDDWEGLETFLETIGLSKYREVLTTQGRTDPVSLLQLTDNDLKDMQVTIGARRKLLAAIKKLPQSGAVATA